MTDGTQNDSGSPGRSPIRQDRSGRSISEILAELQAGEFMLGKLVAPMPIFVQRLMRRGRFWREPSARAAVLGRWLPGRSTDRRGLEAERNALLRLGELAVDAPIQELFDAMAEELGRIVDTETGLARQAVASVWQFHPDKEATLVAGSGGRFDWSALLGTRWPLDGDSANARVYRTGRPARLEGGIPLTGSISRLLNTIEATSSLSVPITVHGELWGSAVVVADWAEPLPANTESQVAQFAALASTAISSAQRREQVGRLVDEHAAMRRVAVLVANGAQPEQVWKTVAAELGELCGAYHTSLSQYDASGSANVVAVWSKNGAAIEAPRTRWPVTGDTLSSRMAATGAVARIDWSEVEGEVGRYIREQTTLGTSIMAPVYAQGELWGGLTAHSPRGTALAEDTDRRLTAFAELVGTSLAHATARAEVRRLADEQASIRRIATKVARQAALDEICQTVTEELAELFDIEDVRLFRFDPGDRMTVLGSHGILAGRYPVGSTHSVTGDVTVARVHREHRIIRLDDPTITGDAHLKCVIATPVRLGDRLWGALIAGSVQPGPIPERALPPLSDAVDLVATAVRKAEADEHVRASRQRIVTATDQARRTFERNLHDGAQQRLVALTLELRTLTDVDGPDRGAVADELDAILTDLRELSRGLHPVALSQGGLLPALRLLVRRCPTPVRLSTPPTWTGADEEAETACYYVAAEALTNIAKHARATEADVALELDDSGITITVSDNGIGGVSPAQGTGLLGIADRVEAFGGHLSVTSPRGSGTTLTAHLPARRSSPSHEETHAASS
ncbi:GAF domain-containing protein [Actinoplanes solisilvae]|uniref:GAF domain-containing protein n=1 Tax=Actinoplanes solisilvae TaxID=2486853 RepID=UPI000FDC3011|nr:GAF domain-containing protein [Actinoplanes solisilvae]